MGTLALTLLIITTLCLIWGIVCIATVASLHERNPDSWHYKMVYDVYDCTPKDTCAYLIKMFNAPFSFLLLLVIAICAVTLIYLFEFFGRWVLAFSLFGKIPAQKLYINKLGTTVTYWQALRKNTDEDGCFDTFPLVQVWHVPPIVLLAGLTLIWTAFTEHQFTTIQKNIILGVSLTITTTMAIVSLVKRVPFTEILDVIQQRVCRPLPLMKKKHSGKR